MSTHLPNGWRAKESKSRPGVIYYINKVTGDTQWEVPTEPADASGESVRVLHILKKHNGSRRPSSWRCEAITQTKDESILQINNIKQQLLHELSTNGEQAMEQLFRKIAQEESDCSSHERGGDLGIFGRGQMQKVFENASFALNPGELSDTVDSDSGIHIILRVQ